MAEARIAQEPTQPSIDLEGFRPAVSTETSDDGLQMLFTPQSVSGFRCHSSKMAASVADICLNDLLLAKR